MKTIEILSKIRQETRRLEERRVMYFIALPAMWSIAAWVFVKKMCFKFFLKKELETNFLFFDGLSKPLRQIKEGAASWRALDIIYNYNEDIRSSLLGIERVLADFWIGMRNAQAVRNRKELVVRLLAEYISLFHGRNGCERVKIFSLASGSAQAVLEAGERAGLPIDLCLLDIDQSALDYSLRLLKEKELEGMVFLSTIRGSATNCCKEIAAFKPQIVEMVGFLDYRPHKKAVALVQKIYHSLPVDCYFITSNICPNGEAKFLKWVINWRMIHRKPKGFSKILQEGGFKKYIILLEPQRIHAIAVAWK